jgi:hypothetical protein
MDECSTDHYLRIGVSEAFSGFRESGSADLEDNDNRFHMEIHVLPVEGSRILGFPKPTGD